MIKWNDGLNLGVKALDDDHKKLLDIINSLSLSLDIKKSQDLIDSTFSNLENYALEHFKREEELLKKCNYKYLDKHIQSHSMFSVKLAELKAKFNNSKDENATKEVIAFLTDWLFDHIIEEDIPLINIFERCGVCEHKKDKLSLFKKLIDKITNTFSFTNRLLFSAFIPLGGMLALILIILVGNYNKHEEMIKTATITSMLSNINNLAHVMQVERGLSCGYISSSDDKFKDNLDKQRKIVNETINLFNTKVKSIDSTKIGKIKSNIEIYKNDIKILENIRYVINKRNISQEIVLRDYTKIIKNILDITSNIAMLNLDAELTPKISTLASLLEFKETLGLKRAVGTSVVEHAGVIKGERIKLIELIANQKVFFNNFNRTATQADKTSLDVILNSEIANKINFYEVKIQTNDFKNLSSVVWFDSMSELINKIKLLENRLLYETEFLIEKILNDEVNTLVMWLIYTLFVFVCTIFIIYIFTRSSREEIYSFTDAIKKLAQGRRDLKLMNLNKKDEMAELYDAYELTRQKLLKADIYIELYLHKQESEIKSQQEKNIELEEMASIDPLTGCINRRKFDEVSNLELQRSMRYKSDLSFLMLDIDHFKAVNDTYGHGIGDEVLKHFSGVCLEMARNIDVVARVGGEEFVVVLPQTNAKGAFIFAERFREKIANSTVVIENQTIKYSVSIGIAVLDETAKDIATILQRADKALYRAKDLGRDRSIVYTSKDDEL